ncbi:MAG: hypothetical protein B6I20_06540 [Bacteroidetes bacterium 4572_117]|nr:MAG: hypothetical protein B6I20_06540 [Bacteroidetes bacterium 4572_117]
MLTKQLFFFTFIVLLFSCNNKKPENMSKKDKAIFLHHSTGTTGLIIWKHCYPVSDISEDIGSPDIEAEEHRLENYKLQYEALKEKMLEFPETKFLVWTGATHAEVNTTEEKAKRMKEFTNWVRNDWDKKGDNIFLWDFYELETEGGLYLKDEHMLREGDSHPNRPFAESLIPMFGKRIVDVFTNKADDSDITGK